MLGRVRKVGRKTHSACGARLLSGSSFDRVDMNDFKYLRVASTTVSTQLVDHRLLWAGCQASRLDLTKILSARGVLSEDVITSHNKGRSIEHRRIRADNLIIQADPMAF